MAFSDRIKTASDGRKYVVVIKGDTLSEIAESYYGNASRETYMQLASINGIKNPDLIYVGEKIYFSKKASSSASSDTEKVTIKRFGLQADIDNVLFVTWDWPKASETAEYKVDWDYYTANKQWFHGSDSSVTVTQNTYSIPSNAKQVRVRIKPIAKTKEEGGEENTPWEAKWSAWTEQTKHTVQYIPKAPANLDVKLEGLTLTATVSNLDDDPTIIKFELVTNDSTAKEMGRASVSTATASCTCTVKAGNRYKVRCQAYKNGVWGDWSNYSQNFETIPSTPSKFTKCEAKSDDATGTPGVYLEWSKVTNAESYEIQYTTKKSYFDTSDQVTTVTTGEGNTRMITSGITNGTEYFFRIRAKNKQGESGWSEVSSAIIGTGPAAPTTWSSTTTVVTGDPLTLYWVHNSEDGSSQVSANIELYVNGEHTYTITSNLKDTTETYVVKNELDGAEESYTIEYQTPEDTNKTRSYSVKTVNDDGTPVYPEGVKIGWRVRTMGIANVYGDWSIVREVEVYAQPTVDFNLYKNESNEDLIGSTVFYKVTLDSASGSFILTNERLVAINGTRIEDGFTEDDEQVYEGEIDEIPVYYVERYLDTVESLPLKVRAVAGPDTQIPISYHLTIKANEPYETVDNVGNIVFVNEGDVVFSKHYDISTVLETELSASDLTLENGMTYTITCTVSMDSGLTAEESIDFTVAWGVQEYTPNAEIIIDNDTYSAYIKPYCMAYRTTYHKVNYQNSLYVATEEVIDSLYGEEINSVTTTGEKVFSGVTADGEEVYFCTVTESTRIEDVLLSVYRREYDGTFTELIRDLDGADNSFITDPHPALDYARYRIVATSKTTGSVIYNDLPGHPVGEKALIIQWEEAWSMFDTGGNEDALSTPPWTGSLLRLPYNIDISYKYSSDTSLVGYIGRKHPVAYYGTQVGETATWSVAIDKNDEETIYALRRLSNWMGNVYVREPSGSGYWANVKVSFNTKHKSVTMPVTIEVTRVEGGA